MHGNSSLESKLGFLRLTQLLERFDLKPMIWHYHTQHGYQSNVTGHLESATLFTQMKRRGV